MSSTVLLLGDSHTDIFQRLPHVSRFDVGQCNTVLFTSHRFTNDNDWDLWSKLDSWFRTYTVNSSNAAKTLVITSGEIDLRVHYWRHLPRNYTQQLSITDFVTSLANVFYSKLVDIADRYALEKIVVWAPPVAGERAHYNSQYPFSGSAQVRNYLIHIWNKVFCQITQNDERISLSTAFYHYVNPITYSASTETHDGVHWPDHFGPEFWQHLILPAIDHKGIYVGENWNTMFNDQFRMCEVVSDGRQLYDSWVRTDHCQQIPDITQTVSINDKSYSWVTADHRHRLPKDYIELSLEKYNS